MFHHESTYSEPLLGFKDYPKDSIAPNAFDSSSLEFPCRILYSSATDYSKKVGWFRKRYKTEWFVKIINSEPAETRLSIGGGGMQMSATLQLNPSLLDGITIGGFKERYDALEWIKDNLST